MTIHAILTVDLNGSVSTAARAKFYEVLKSHHYLKHKLTTLWTVQFTASTTQKALSGLCESMWLLLQGLQVSLIMRPCSCKERSRPLNGKAAVPQLS